MIQTANISCRISAPGPGLHLRVTMDDTILFDGDPNGDHPLLLTMTDDDADHALVFELSGKTPQHTKIDQDGQILEDLVVKVTDIAFDEIQLGHVLTAKAVYRHDFNGTADPVEEKFYGVMGCNGTVTLPFTTPIYLWLLENM